METFDQIWENRTNAWSWAYPSIVWSGVVALTALSLIPDRWLRRAAKLAIMVSVAFIATHYSARAIEEKWQIRGEWADAHRERMTDEAWHALTVDGANRTLGPIFYGFQAFFVFAVVCAILTVARHVVWPLWRIKSRGHNREDTESITAAAPSDNPYDPALH